MKWYEKLVILLFTWAVAALVFVSGALYERRQHAQVIRVSALEDGTLPLVTDERGAALPQDPDHGTTLPRVEYVFHDQAFTRGTVGYLAFGVRDDNGQITRVTNGDFVAFRMDADGYVLARCK